MTDKEFAFEKARIRKLVDRWVRPLGLNWFKLDIDYERVPLEPPQSATGHNKTYQWRTQANTAVVWEYRKASMAFDMNAIHGSSDDELESLFVHELCHILVNEMREWSDDDKGRKHEESVVEGLARAFVWTRDAGFDEGKKRRKR